MARCGSRAEVVVPSRLPSDLAMPRATGPTVGSFPGLGDGPSALARRFTLALRCAHLYGEDLALTDSSVSSPAPPGPVNGAPLCHGRT